MNKYQANKINWSNWLAIEVLEAVGNTLPNQEQIDLIEFILISNNVNFSSIESFIQDRINHKSRTSITYITPFISH